MRNFGITLIFTALFAGVFGTAHSHDIDSLHPSQTAVTPEPGGLFGDNNDSSPSNNAEDGATVFDFSTMPNEDVFFVENGQVEDDVLILNAPESGDAFAEFFIPIQDYAIEMDITFLFYDEETIFLYLLMRIQDNFCNFEFAYDPVFGEVYTTLRLPEDCEDWNELEDAIAQPMEIGETYNVRVVAQGNTYSLFINDEVMISVEDDTLPDGYVGIIGILGPAEAIIENLTVTDLSATSGATAPGTEASDGLFGGSADAAPTTEPSSGGLFGNTDEAGSTSESSSSGLFGGSSDSSATATPSSGGLFGND